MTNPGLLASVEPIKKKNLEYYRQAVRKPVYLCANILDPRSKLVEISDATLAHAQIPNREDLKTLFLNEARQFVRRGNHEATTPDPEPETEAETSSQPKTRGPRRFISRTGKRSIEEEVEVYLTGVRESGDCKPLLFWKSQENNLPILSRMARAYLSIQATSCPSEREFSAGGRVWSILRQSLTTSSCEALVCLKTWDKVL